jgi:predicted alpha/beta-hydrolase family hydrolase
VKVVEVETPHGPARAHVDAVDGAKAGLVLGHGAGGGVDAPDLVAATEAASSRAVSTALLEQPYRVAGRRSQAPQRQLDAAWTSVVEQLREGELAGLPLIVGGRSAGARVACRTVESAEAIAMLCLAFPLQPPPRGGRPPGPSRLDELDAVKVPMLIVQGERDRFGTPPARRGRKVVEVPGDHSLRKDPEAVAAAVQDWLPGVLAKTAPAAASAR